jgi:3-deoxy-manno-octulosonate cytidylyltransferase (CMP-KDO synthetase)
MRFVVIVPARLASSRLPRKPLADIHGLPMVVRVAQRARLARADRVVVATDSDEVASACSAEGVECLMTRADHASGSDRLAEACTLLGLPDDEVVVNVQGDEPLIEPDVIDACADLLAARGDCVMSTVAHAIDDAGDFVNPNVVKVVLDRAQRALYFSRAPIPWWRDGSRPGQPALPLAQPALRHVGLYAYRAGFLRRFPGLEPAPTEGVEALEQLRVLWHGERIAVHVADAAPAPGVDTPEDLERVRRLFAQGHARGQG